MTSKNNNQSDTSLKIVDETSHTYLHQTKSLEEIVKILAHDMAQQIFDMQLDYTKAANDEGQD